MRCFFFSWHGPRGRAAEAPPPHAASTFPAPAALPLSTRQNLATPSPSPAHTHTHKQSGNAEVFKYVGPPSNNRRQALSLIKRGDHYGDEYLLSGQPATSGMATLSAVTALTVRTPAFLRFVGSYLLDLQDRMAAFLRVRVPCLRAFSHEEVRALTSYMAVRRCVRACAWVLRGGLLGVPLMRGCAVRAQPTASLAPCPIFPQPPLNPVFSSSQLFFQQTPIPQKKNFPRLLPRQGAPPAPTSCS